jgi:Helicase
MLALNSSRPVTLGRDFARALDPVLFVRDLGLEPDAAQEQLLTSTANKIILNCCRQFGKSEMAGAKALHTCLYQAPAFVVLVSPSQPQSTELFKKIHSAWQRLEGAPEAKQESLTRMELANGSRIISLPGSEKTTRGYSAADLVIADEAARIDDALLAAIRPMLAVKNGQFIALSTPKGKRGWFYEAWTSGDDSWERISVKAVDCPRITKEFLADEMKALGPLRFSEEYECAFIDSETSAFSSALIEMALTDGFELF